MISKKGSLSPFLSSDPCLKFATGNYDSSSVFKSHFSQFASFPGSWFQALHVGVGQLQSCSHVATLFERASESLPDEGSRLLLSVSMYENLRCAHQYTNGRTPDLVCRWAEEKIAASVDNITKAAKMRVLWCKSCTSSGLFAETGSRSCCRWQVQDD